jgi:hypothetical protein
MAQIFISHSKNDKDLIHFFLEAFAGTKVKPHLEELEKELPTGINAQKIQQDIQDSNAVFVLLSENVESLKHTRDWVNWECGTAINKDIWIFEPFNSLGKISVVIPRFDHYALFTLTEDWRKYLLAIIESYDDSHVLETLAIPTAGGALLNEKDRMTGAAFGFGLGLFTLLLQNMSKTPLGISVRCGNCNSNYRIHQFGNFRCAICNTKSFLPQPEQIPNVNPNT